MRASAARGSPWLPVHSATHLVGRQIAVGSIAAEILHAVEIAGLARDLHDALHGAADHHDFAAGGARGLGDRAHARHIGGECRDRDAARRGADQLGERLRDVGLRGRAALAHRIGGIADQRQAALVAERARASPRRSAAPMIGVGSIFQSPVCSTVPSGVRMISAFDSGIECATETKLDVERPERRSGRRAARPSPGFPARPARPARLASNSAAVNGVA